MMSKIGRLTGLMLLLALVIPVTAMARTATVAGVTMTTPDTYHSCTATSDKIIVTGLTGSGLKLVGKAIVAIILSDGSRQTFAEYPINSTENFELMVSYPPFSDVPPQSDDTREIHVDIQSELFNAEDYLVGTLGPGLDWDVFCQDTPPPPPPPPPGGEGCTPGYWRNHLDDWAATGYAPGDDFDATFGVDLFDPNISLETAVNLGGGGVKRLARHGVAALLSAAHPDVNYPLDVAGVIAAVQAGDADALATYNELGCSIN